MAPPRDQIPPAPPGPAPEGWFDGFPTEPCGGNNPYYRCRCCRRSVPEINYRLDGHSRDCAWRRLVEAGQRGHTLYGEMPTDDILELITCHQCGRDLYPGDRGFGTRGAWCEKCRDAYELGEL